MRTTIFLSIGFVAIALTTPASASINSANTEAKNLPGSGSIYTINQPLEALSNFKEEGAQRSKGFEIAQQEEEGADQLPPDGAGAGRDGSRGRGRGDGGQSDRLRRRNPGTIEERGNCQVYGSTLVCPDDDPFAIFDNL